MQTLRQDCRFSKRRSGSNNLLWRTNGGTRSKYWRRSTRKHIPAVSIEGNIVTIKDGEVTHPSIENHYIEWIMIQTNFGNQRKVLRSGDEPVAKFALLEGEKVVKALEYCNLHGLYSTE